MHRAVTGAASSGRIVDSLPEEQKAIGSSLMNFIVYIGSTIGTALFASLLTTGSGSAGVAIEDLSPEAFMEGMVVAMLCGVLLSVVSFVAAFAVKEKRLPSADNE